MTSSHLTHLPWERGCPRRGEEQAACPVFWHNLASSILAAMWAKRVGCVVMAMLAVYGLLLVPDGDPPPVVARVEPRVGHPQGAGHAMLEGRRERHA